MTGQWSIITAVCIMDQEIMTSMLKHKTKIRMHHTDSAGVVFYANLFVMAHDCYEIWMDNYISLADILQQNIQIPIVHAEADYTLPIRLSDEMTIEMTLVKKRRSSFALQYLFRNADGEQAALVKTVHAVINGPTRQSIKIPPILQDALSSL